MIKVIRRLLEDIINNIDAGNSNLSEEECLKAIDLLKEFTDKRLVLNREDLIVFKDTLVNNKY